MTRTADIIIIGAGAAGLGAAAHLAPYARVIVLEAEDVACFHSTGRSAAVYLKSYGPSGVRAATAASEAFFQNPDGGADAPLLTPRGQLMLQYDDVEDHLSPLIAQGTGVEAISVAEAMSLVPVLKPDGLAAAGYESVALDIDVDLLMGCFRRMMKAGRAEVVTKARVTGLRRQAGIWHAATAAGAFAAPLVINAAGAWASTIAGLAGASTIRIQPKRRSAAMVPLPEGVECADWPLFDDTAERWYAKPQGRALMVSPADADPVEACDIWPDDMVLAEGIDRFAQRVSFDVTRIGRTWAGLRSFSPDGEPVVGLDPIADGFFWVAGQGGYGIQTCPGLSALTRDLVLGQGTALTAEATSRLSPLRFS
jgi:D-arginine dehydrogenase